MKGNTGMSQLAAGFKNFSQKPQVWVWGLFFLNIMEKKEKKVDGGRHWTKLLKVIVLHGVKKGN